MTRKDYNRAVEVIRQFRNSSFENVSEKAKKIAMNLMQQAFIAFFQGENKRFNACKFLAQCQGEPANNRLLIEQVKSLSSEEKIELLGSIFIEEKDDYGQILFYTELVRDTDLQGNDFIRHMTEEDTK